MLLGEDGPDDFAIFEAEWDVDHEVIGGSSIEFYSQLYHISDGNIFVP